MKMGYSILRSCTKVLEYTITSNSLDCARDCGTKLKPISDYVSDYVERNRHVKFGKKIFTFHICMHRFLSCAISCNACAKQTLVVIFAWVFDMLTNTTVTATELWTVETHCL